MDKTELNEYLNQVKKKYNEIQKKDNVNKEICERIEKDMQSYVTLAGASKVFMPLDVVNVASGIALMASGEVAVGGVGYDHLGYPVVCECFRTQIGEVGSEDQLRQGAVVERPLVDLDDVEERYCLTGVDGGQRCASVECVVVDLCGRGYGNGCQGCATSERFRTDVRRIGGGDGLQTCASVECR